MLDDYLPGPRLRPLIQFRQRRQSSRTAERQAARTGHRFDSGNVDVPAVQPSRGSEGLGRHRMAACFQMGVSHREKSERCQGGRKSSAFATDQMVHLYFQDLRILFSIRRICPTLIVMPTLVSRVLNDTAPPRTSSLSEGCFAGGSDGYCNR